jgi:hypothetical protein
VYTSIPYWHDWITAQVDTVSKAGGATRDGSEVFGRSSVAQHAGQMHAVRVDARRGLACATFLR